MLSVAPSGTTKLATSFFTPTRCSTVRKVTGSVAPLEAVLNATSIGSRILPKNRIGLTLPSTASSIG